MELFLQVIFTQLCHDVTVVDACENFVALQDVGVLWKAFENLHLILEKFAAGF